MHLAAFIDRICDDGILAARLDYAGKPAWIEGAVAGFEACRGKTTDAILELYAGACAETLQAAAADDPDDYWRARCRAAEIEWVLNCVSAAVCKPLLHWLPTYRGAVKAHQVVRDLLVQSQAPAHDALDVDAGPNRAGEDR